MIKLSRRARIWIAILILFLPGVLCLGLMPSSVEGFYDPFSSLGCTGDQFMEMRNGRVIRYVMCSKQSHLSAFYEKDASGSITFRFASEGTAESAKPIMRAEPHLLGTRFYYLGDGKSEWKWKRLLVTRSMRNHMASAEIYDVVFEKDGTRITIYDSKFNVTSSTLKPKTAASPSKSALPAAGR